MAATLGCLAACRAAPQAGQIPPFEKLAVVVRQQAARLGLGPHAVVTRGQVRQLLSPLKQAGWQVPEAEELLARALPDGDFLVKELRSPAGQRMVGKLADPRQALDRLDRLRRLPRGEQTVRDLVADPHGHEMIDYLTSTPGGRELGKQLSAAPRGGQFNEPTGRIYTTEDLLAELRRRHARQESSRHPPGGNR